MLRYNITLVQHRRCSAGEGGLEAFRGTVLQAGRRVRRCQLCGQSGRLPPFEAQQNEEEEEVAEAGLLRPVALVRLSFVDKSMCLAKGSVGGAASAPLRPPCCIAVILSWIL